MGSCDQSLLVEEFECGSSHLGFADVGKGSVEIGERLCGPEQSGLAEVGEGCGGDCLSVDCRDLDFEEQFCSELIKEYVPLTVTNINLDSAGATNIDPSTPKFREGSEAGIIDCSEQEVSHTECGEDGVCLHGGIVESEGLCLENRSGLDVSETPLTLSPLTGPRSNCGEADEQKHIESADIGGAVRVVETGEVKNKIVGIWGCQEGSGEGCERIDMNSIGDSSGKTSPEAIEESEKGDVNTMIRVPPSLICRMSVDALPTAGSAGNCAHHDEGKDKNCVSYGFAERGSEMVHEKREIDSCTYILLSHCNHEQQNDSDINKVSDGSAIRVMEMREDKHDLVIGAEVEPHLRRSPVEEDSSNIKECSLNIAFDLDVDSSAIPDACPLVSISTNEPCKRLDVSDCSGVGAVIAGPNLSILTDGLEQKDGETNEGRNNIVFDGYLGAKTSNYICQSFQSMHLSRSKRSTKKEKVPKKIRKAVNKGSYSHETIEISSVTSRRKRSCPYKSRRSSNWGSLGNILDLFEQKNQPVVHKVIEHCSNNEQNLNGGKQNKCNGNREGRSSPSLKGKSQPVTGRIRLKIKMGKKGDQSSIKMLASEPECNSAPDHGVIGKYRHDFLEDIIGEDVPMIRPYQCMKKHPENASYPAVHLKDQSLESTINLNKSSRNNAGDIELEVAGMGDVTENSHIDPGTSPDSEVINQIPDARVGLQVQQSPHDDPMTSSSGIVFPEDVMQLNFPGVSRKKGTKKGTKNPLFANGSINNVLSKKRGMKKNVADELNSEETSENIEKLMPSLKLKGKISSKSSKSRGDGKFKSDETYIIGSRRENVYIQDIQRKSANKSIKEKDVKVEDNREIGNLVVDDCGITNMSNKSGSEDKSNLDMVQSGVMESYIPPRNAWVSCDECQKWRRIPATLADCIEETNSKWTCMDNMDKAFANCSTPQEKSNSEINAELEISDAEDATNAGFNNSKGLERRHPAVSQPSSWILIKSNIFKHRKRKTQTIDEIMVCYCTPRALGRSGCGDTCLNRMLNIECVRGTCPCGDSCSNQQFQKHNYAKLKSFRCGKKGYGLQLLEDISKGQFLIEYVGEVLDMHAYEARQVEYASRGHTHFYFMTLNGSEVIDACVKGNLGRFINHSCDPNCRTEKWMVNGEICIGLFAIRDIKKGEELTFDYNYVRVVGAAAKKCVCGSSQCRGYIGGDPLSTEVIVQGDSDDEYPEPVMVLENGETINSLDCLVPKARSYSVEEMQTGEASKGRISIVECTGAVGQLEITSENEDSTQRSASSAPLLQISSKCMGPIGIIPSSNQPVQRSLETEEVTNNPIPIAHQDITEKQEAVNKSTCSPKLEASLTSTLEKSISDSYDNDSKMSQLDKVEGNPVFSKSLPMIKKSKSSRSVKKGKHKTNMVAANKSQMTPNKPKKVMQGTDTGRNETFEEKLNELLDADGGISKQKDASKGYLKLLLLTAASGDSVNGEAIQSNRDLSIILEVLLKTKSRMVLVDIINKNGLRMLHNIMKQSRKEYNKTPILRKLLKVLEYLATKEILTLEHINVGPPCPGMESFRQSILALTEHSNKQVHQIARNFRDRWIRRSSRKHGCEERGDGRKEKYKGLNCNRLVSSYRQDHTVRGAEATESTKQSLVAASSSAGTPEEGSLRSGGDGSIHTAKIRKRKSRWDVPAQTSTDLVSHPYKEQKLQPSKSISLLESCSVMQKDDSIMNHTLQDASDIANEGGQSMHEDVPPGFSLPLDTRLVSPRSSIDLPEVSGGHSTATFEIVAGFPQERFRSWLPVSYGIPLSLLQQNGIPETASDDGWIIAPGIVFHPFPPLPSYPPNSRNPSSCSIKSLNGNEARDVQLGSCGSALYHMDHNSPSTSSTNLADGNVAVPNNQHMFDQARASSVVLGKRFRQQKWNNNKLAPPWARSKWDQTESTPRNGMCTIDVGSVQNEHKNPYHSENISRIQPGGNTFYRQPQHQNQH